MIQYDTLLEHLDQSHLSALSRALKPSLTHPFQVERWGDLPTWIDAYEAVPTLKPSVLDLQSQVKVGCAEDCDNNQQQALRAALRAMMPWRKGPFSLFGIDLDCEWRSDWKWQRVAPHLKNLSKRIILDVGCGNGYYALRMLGAGAQRVIGIDPSPRFVFQFYQIKKLIGEIPVDILPIGIEALPKESRCFDTTFSMGVFYHRRSPMDHLRELRETLVSGGELVLETLVIDGKLGEVLVPEGRYAMMNNVWFIPSCLTLEGWMRKSGFKNVRLVDLCPTTPSEQRATEWMQFQSLKDFLNPNNPQQTIEGHPAPLRAVFLAESGRE